MKYNMRNYLVIVDYQTWECLGKISSEPILNVLVGACPHVMPQKQIVPAEGWVVPMVEDLGRLLLVDTPFLPVMKSGLLAHLDEVGWVALEERVVLVLQALASAKLIASRGTTFHDALDPADVVLLRLVGFSHLIFLDPGQSLSLPDVDTLGQRDIVFLRISVKGSLGVMGVTVKGEC